MGFGITGVLNAAISCDLSTILPFKRNYIYLNSPTSMLILKLPPYSVYILAILYSMYFLWRSTHYFFSRRVSNFLRQPWDISLAFRKIKLQWIGHILRRPIQNITQVQHWTGIRREVVQLIIPVISKLGRATLEGLETFIRGLCLKSCLWYIILYPINNLQYQVFIYEFVSVLC